MKRFLSLLLVLLLAVSLAACGGSARSESSVVTKGESFSQNDMKLEESAPEMGWVEAPMESTIVADSAAAMGSGKPAALENAKIIYRGELYLETKEFDQAGAALDTLVKTLGGFYESRNINQGGTYRSLHATVRVPSAHFSAFLQQAGEAAHVTDCYEYTENISEAYYDTESRLITQRTKLERLQELLKQAESMEDIITLESAISETELTIERLTGSLRKYDNLVDFSTITLSLNEVYRLSTDEVPEQTFGDRLGNAFVRGLERGISSIENFIISIARNWVNLLIWAVVLVIGFTVARHKWRSRRPISLRKRSKGADTEPAGKNSEE